MGDVIGTKYREEKTGSGSGSGRGSGKRETADRAGLANGTGNGYG